MSINIEKLSKGDKFKDTWGSGQIYTFIKSTSDQSIIYRDTKGQTYISSIAKVENFFEMIYKWTPWRPDPEDSTALYKTNRKRIWYKKNGIKVKSDCWVQEDKFDLNKGLAICRKRWQAKNKRHIEGKIESFRFEPQTESRLNIYEHINNCIIDTDFRHCIVNYIDNNFNSTEQLKQWLDDYCGLTAIFKNEEYDYIVYFDDNIDSSLVIYKNIFSLVVLVSDFEINYNALKRSWYELFLFCFENKYSYLALIPAYLLFDNITQEEERNLIKEAFDKVYKDFKDKENYKNFKIYIDCYHLF